MMHVSLEIAQRDLPDLIESVRMGEQVLITKDDKPVAQLVPISESKGTPKFGSAKGAVFMSDDFDAPISDFEG
jgi:prevent-host-death family protein